MKIDFETLLIICDLYKYVPLQTSNRITVILQFAQYILAASSPSCTTAEKPVSGHGKSKHAILMLHDGQDPLPFQEMFEIFLRKYHTFT